MKKINPIPEGYQSINVYLVIKNAAQSIKFYEQAFGAIEKSRYEFPDGRILFAELQIGNSIIQISDEFSERQVTISSPQTLGGICCVVHLSVEDVDKVFSQALTAGATLLTELTNTFWGARYGQVKDPFGYVWSIATQISQPSKDEIQKSVEQLIKQSQ